jgi:hypothetical protein
VDLSTSTRLPFWFASDALGSPIEFSYSKSAFAQGEPDANTVGLWRLEESAGSGAYIKDSSGNGHHGTPSGTSFVRGKFGMGRSFSGNHINLGTSVNVANQSFTLEAWAKRNAISADHHIFGQGPTSTNNGLHVGFRNTNVFTCAFYSNDLNTPAYSDTDWHHWVCTYDVVSRDRRIYRDGLLVAQDTASANYQGTGQFNIGAGYSSPSSHFNGIIDEVRISNIARSAEEIKQAYELGRRSHVVTVDFRAKLDSGNLIDTTSDLSFTIDETAYGASRKGNNLFSGDQVIIKENYDGVEYIAQGTVSSVNASTGAVTVSAWNSGSTVPPVGFSTHAIVFKWQREYMDITGVLPEDRNAISHVTYRLLDGTQGRTIWLDDLRMSGDYLNNPLGSSITSSGLRFFQYRTIFSSWDPYVSVGLHSVTLNYSPVPDLRIPGACRINEDRANLRLGVMWNDTSTDESGFEVERNENDQGFSALTTTTANASSYLDQTVENGNTYSYRVRAYADDPPETGDWCTTSTLTLQVGHIRFEGVRLDGIKIR